MYCSKKTCNLRECDAAVEILNCRNETVCFEVVKVQFLSTVWLSGGPQPYEGNVNALNPDTGVRGPICDTFWTIENVRFIRDN